MNISTGGPHILFFERDQQLAMLLTSEFQLAGYECHTARTAVEVFDAIARYPVRLVLVNLAQAAAGRREFWVALDTQRRGRGVQVLTFHCFNLAGYGARDPDESAQAMLADMEIDGMTGIMGLVEAVRSRIPSASSTTNTMPRIPRIQTPPQPPVTAAAPASASPNYAQYSASTTGGTAYRSAAPAQETLSPARASQGATLQTQAQVASGLQTSQVSMPPTQVSPMQPPPQGSQTYSDKIRAVLYPNQRAWSTPNGAGTTISTLQEGTRTIGDVQAVPPAQPVQPAQPAQTAATQGGSYYQVPSQPASPPAQANDISALQRLANGQAGESGLAQLSRMVQARYTTTAGSEERTPTVPLQQPREAAPPIAANQPGTYQAAAPRPAPIEQTMQPASTNSQSPTSQVVQASPVRQEPAVPQPPATLVTRPASISESADTPSLRASPIQDMPVERAVGNQVTAEGTRRIDASARQALANPPTQPTPLASITTPMPAAPAVPQTPPIQTYASTPLQVARDEDEDEEREPTGPLAPKAKAKAKGPVELQDIAALLEQRQRSNHGLRLELDESVGPDNAMLLDIVQSLPPMPPPSQPLQMQVLNGRATRSLGSVLLEGHLVPENRLEVAQNIQRMLRGVDLNYQLGEILLMFKLLTPDQLLAASLVSYGMITTTQISSLGRIRQELHAIGLEYDLENLLIVFRILSPEQLREVRSSWQG